MKSVKSATLLAGAGIEGDRYVLKTGTYSAKFLYEPGRNLTLVSADGVEAQVAKTKMEPLQMSALRRNLVVRGLSAEAVNAMVGHEVAVQAPSPCDQVKWLQLRRASNDGGSPG